MSQSLKNVVVVGGSYVGVATAKELASILPPSHRVLLVEPHSHFHHLFAFPRFSILPSHEHKSFIPYTTTFSHSPLPSSHSIIQAAALSILPPSSPSPSLLLDRPYQNSTTLPYDYLIAATGTTLSPPGTIPHHTTKPPSITFLQSYQSSLSHSNSIIIIGGGAVGVQMACDLREIYPSKTVTLIHSRDQLMPLYHPALSTLVKSRFSELGVNLITGTRVILPSAGFPLTSVPRTKVNLQDGRTLTADFVITATGQTPNNSWLTAGLGEDVINPLNGFIKVHPTMQVEGHKNVFAVGDINDCGAHKAAKPGLVQAGVAARNIVSLINGGEAEEKLEVAPASIHLTLGLKKNVIFRNPDTAKGVTEPYINLKDDGREDMNMAEVWGRRGPKVTSESDYHL
ncbi:hypothetical protein QBC40DRAFT_277791 [Triangularia verruculosa]|uniref:FAD/NAD(P)-binding domain-containing protein n=1 Tax=Triangularia verruculosa TaxID=2587418 RepID=A0AAN6XJR8_9PEZI|nr:hypothetical protein QBC40DRAFT_277791 [Triangularia verruculosa]